MVGGQVVLEASNGQMVCALTPADVEVALKRGMSTTTQLFEDLG